MPGKVGTKPAAADSPSGLKQRASRLSRVRACAECKRHKIKCEVKRGETACARCLRTGLECLPYDPAQRLWDEDAAWKTEAAANIAQLQAAVNNLLQRGQLSDLTSFTTDPSQVHNIQNGVSKTSPTNSALGSISVKNASIVPIEMRGEDSPEQDDGAGDDPGLVPAPMRNLYELTKVNSRNGNTNGNTNGAANGNNVSTRQPATSIEEDIVSQGIVSIDEAELLFNRFLTNHHPLLWGGVIFPQRTLTSARRASPLLSTAILTVAALHSPDHSETLQICYDAFVNLVSNSCLARHHNLDDLRGLVVAAFYLPNLSWRLSGQASRIAAEMNIHHSFRKLMNGDTSQHERVRLWYALYVCDRHFSIAYGRPSAMYDDAAVRGVEQFIQSPLAEIGDIRLSAQVALFKILTEAFLEFGTDQSEPLREEDLDRLRTYNMAIEQWRMLWQPRSPDSAGIGSYPSAGVVMYYHFARFQLNSLALRGVQWPSSEPLSINRREAVMTGISAAMSTLMFILRETDMRKSLPGVPLFPHTLVAFCATFLLKLANMLGRGGHDGDDVAQSLGFGFNVQEVLRLTRQSADMLSEVAEKVSDKHLVRLVVTGIREALQRVEVAEELNGASRGATAAADGVNGINGVNGVNGNGNVMANGAGGDYDVPDAPPLLGNGVHNPRTPGAVPDISAAVGGAPGTEGVGGMTYNMDLNELVGLLENGFDETFLGHFPGEEFDSWGATT